MNKEKRFAVIDTETLGGATSVYCPCYHLAAVAMTKKNDIFSKINIIILENLDLTSAFYGKMKKEYYRSLLKEDNVIICYTEQEACEIFTSWLVENNISCVCAYNSGFDFVKTFVARCVVGYEFIDLQYAFFDTIARYKKYNQFCQQYGYVTKKNNLQMTVEIAYRFLSGQNDFVEEHTALSDSEVEAEILKAVWATHRKFTRNVHKGAHLYKQIKVRA